MEKRNFFEELMQGFDELKRERQGKLMPRNQDAEKPSPTVAPTEDNNHQVENS